MSYHGVLPPRHRLQSQVIPEPPIGEEPRDRLTNSPPPGRSRWHGWADLLWRVFAVDGFACTCGGRLGLHAVARPPATLDVLASLEGWAQRHAPAPPIGR